MIASIFSVANAQNEAARESSSDNKAKSAFYKGMSSLEIGTAFVKGTKNNVGMSVEYGLSNVFGIEGGVATVSSSYSSAIGFGFGLKAHSGYTEKIFDISPALYWSKIMGKYESKQGIWGVGLNARVFLAQHFALGFGVGKAFGRASKLSPSVSVILR